MTAPRDPSERLAALMNAFAEQVDSASDEDLLEDATKAGVDVSAEASRVRATLFGGVVRAKGKGTSQLRDAPRKALSVASARSRIPRAPLERRTLLLQALERRPQMRDVPSIQGRDLAACSDADVEKILQELEVLGLLGRAKRDT